jgi:Protein of unknown function (DUF295)
LPEAANKWVRGSSCGWLVLVDTNGTDISLLNPLTRRVIQLPSVDTFTPRLNGLGQPDVPIDGRCYIHKAILSANPTISEQDCIVMAIVGEMLQLSYCRIGDKKWTNVDNCLYALWEVIHHEGTFYATTVRGVLMSFNIEEPNSTKIVAIGLTMYLYVNMDKKYLIMASGRLLLVSIPGQYDFKVYALNKRKSSFIQEPISHSLPIASAVEICHEWVEIDSVDDHLLFVGNNDSFSLPARPYEMYGGMANCIYFTEDYFFNRRNGSNEDHRIGVFNIAKKYACLYNGNVRDKLFPSFWVTPTPW